jgi:SSS family solute:Na+ symporter
MMGVVAIGFAGTTVTLVPGFTIQFGLLGGMSFAFFYNIMGLMLFAVLYASFIRRCGAQTLPEYLEMRYGGKIRSLVAVTSVIGMAGILANNIVSAVDNIVGYTGWDRMITMAIIFLVIIAFTFISGLWATTLTDFFQVVLGIIVVPTVLFLLIRRFGWLDAIAKVWPGNNIVSAGHTGSMAIGKLTYPSMLNFFICFAAALVWGNNYYWMKMANCRNEKVARNSYLLGALLLFFIYFIAFALIGLFAGGFHSEVFTFKGGRIPPTGAYGFIASTFAPLFGSIAVIGAVAAAVSTSSTAALGASAVANRDIYQRLINTKADPKSSLKVSKIILFLIGIVTFILCQFPGGPTYLFAFANCWLIPPAILLGLGAIWPRFGKQGAIVGVLCGMITMATFTLLGTVLRVFDINRYIYLAVLGFIVTLVTAVIGTLTEKPKYYGAKTWERVPNSSNREDIKLDERCLEVLALIRLGHLYMADLTDYLGVDSQKTNEIIEQLDRGGYIVRAGLNTSKFYTFSITEKGRASLAPLPDREMKLAEDMLSPLYLELLRTVKETPEEQFEFIRKNEIRSMRMAAIASHHARQGYITEKGLFKRKLEITVKGIQAVQKYS